MRAHRSLLLSPCLVAALAAQQGVWSTIPGNPGQLQTTQGLMTFDRARGRCVLVNGSEIWESTGTTWQRVASGAGIGGIGGAFAYDEVRGASYWFGGGFVFFFDNRTFRWDGSTWTQVATAVSPPGRTDTAMAFDAARGRMVLFGGVNAGGTLGDTWEFDGVNWQQRAPATSPPPTLRHRMTFDAARAETVLYVGRNGVGETWLYDGANWRAGPVGPPSYYSPALVYDAARQRTVLTSGNALYGAHLETWEWDGIAWSSVQPVGPIAYHTVNGAYDSVHGHALLVAATDDAIDDWRWDGNGWRRNTPFGIPPSVSGVALAYHRGTRALIAFGGSVSVFGPYLDSTRAYRQGTWRRLLPAVAPPGRADAAMATAASGEVLLFGGRDATVRGDTWQFDGVTWQPLTTATAPPARSHHRMATDLLRGRVVLFGGQDAASTPLADTWEWDGTTWLQPLPAASPPARIEPAMAFDLARGRTVLFGGSIGTTTYMDDHWEWDGASWTQPSLALRPGPRAAAVMAFDPGAGVVVLAGGNTYNFLGVRQVVPDSWLWDGVTWTPVTGSAPAFAVTAVGAFHEELRSTIYSANGVDHELTFGSTASATTFGAGCGGTVSPPRLSALSPARTGNTGFGLWLTNALGNVLAVVGIDTVSTAIPLGGGCTALVPFPALVPIFTDPAGGAHVPLAIPGDPWLHGVSLYCQAVALDPNGALFRLATMSAGLRLVLD